MCLRFMGQIFSSNTHLQNIVLRNLVLTDAETPFYESYDEFANLLSNTFSYTMKASYSAAALLNHEDLSDVSSFS